MRTVLLTGDDELAVRARRTDLLRECGVDGGAVERFDITEDGGSSLARAAGAMSLFGGPRVLDGTGAQALTVDAATAIGSANSDAVVLLRADSAVPAAARKALGDIEVISCRLPAGKGVAIRVDELARDAGITLDSAARGLLADRAGHDLPRVASVLAQLAAAELRRPRREQVLTLLGSAAAPEVPWALSDAVEAGDTVTALRVAAGLEPVAVVAYLASRAGQLGRIVDEGLRGGDQVAAALGISPYPAQKLAALAGRIGPGGVAATWDLVAAADRAVKVGGTPAMTLDLLIVELTAVWAGRRTEMAESRARPPRSPLPS